MSLISYHLRVIECLTQLLKPAIVGDNVEFIIRTPQNSISLVCPLPFLPSKPLGASAFFERERERVKERERETIFRHQYFSAMREKNYFPETLSGFLSG